MSARFAQNVGVNEIFMGFLVEQKNFSRLNKLLGVMGNCKEKFLDLVNHVHPIETSWCGENFRVVFDILFVDKV